MINRKLEESEKSLIPLRSPEGDQSEPKGERARTQYGGLCFLSVSLRTTPRKTFTNKNIGVRPSVSSKKSATFRSKQGDVIFKWETRGAFCLCFQ